MTWTDLSKNKLERYRASTDGFTVGEVRRTRGADAFGAVPYWTTTEKTFKTLNQAKNWVEKQHAEWMKSVNWA